MTEYVPATELLPVIDRLIRQYGSILAAGWAYDARYGLRSGVHGGAGARQITRIRGGRVKRVRYDTFDRFEVLAS